MDIFIPTAGAAGLGDDPGFLGPPIVDIDYCQKLQDEYPAIYAQIAGTALDSPAHCSAIYNSFINGDPIGDPVYIQPVLPPALQDNSMVVGLLVGLLIIAIT